MFKRKLLVCALAIVSAVLVCFCTLTACGSGADTRYTVTFALDGGMMDGKAEVRVAEGSMLELSDYLPHKTGSSFVGWQAEDTSYTGNETLTVEADITLTALWRLNRYTVTFKDGEDILKTETVEYGKTATAPDVLTKTGYSFVGWDVAYDNVVSDLTVCAKWEIVKYAVTFLTDGGTMTEPAIMVDHGSELVFSEYTPKKVGYVFNGWRSGESVYTSSDSLTVTSEVEFTALWTFAYKTENLSDGTLAVTGFVGDSLETVELPAEYNGKRITQIKANAFYRNGTVKHVVLDGMSYLESVGNGAFYTCSQLEAVSLSGLSSLKTLGDTVFSGDYSVGGRMTSVDFTGCTGLESIGQMVFQYQTALTSVDLTPCTSLTRIDRQMFDGCSALQTVGFPRALQTINGERGGAVNSDFFRGCDALKSITVQAGSLYFESSDGVLYLRGKTGIVKYPAAKDASEFVAPSDVTQIYGSAFQNAENLTRVDLSACNGLTEIMFNAFCDCSVAELTVPFDQNGYYLNGTHCTLGNRWDHGVKRVVYGERYYFFEATFSGISDGMTTARESLSFEAAVVYGEYACTLTVVNVTTGVGGSVGADGTCTVALQTGANEIAVTASCAEKSESKTFTFTITLDNGLSVVSSLKAEGLNSASDGYTFTVSVQDTEGGKVSVTDKLKVAVDCGYSAPAYTDLIKGTLYTVTYSADGTVATFASDFDTLLMWDYAVDGTFHIKISYTVSAQETADAVYEMCYTPAPELTVSGIANGSTFGEDETPRITVRAREANGSVIGSDRLSVKVDWGWGEQAFAFYEIVSEQDGTIAIELD